MDSPVKSVCRICHGGCGALLYTEKNRLVRIKPDSNSPFNRGEMCIKGLATTEMMYHPSRILQPLKRRGDRGSNQWDPLSWDQAVSEIAGRIDRIRTSLGPEAIAVGQGTGRHHFMHVIRFANALGTPNWYEPGLANCFIPRISVCNLTYGGFVSADYYSETPPKTILFWGHNPLVTGADGELSFPVKRALKAGSFGIAIDPRRSETADRSSLWLPLRPGTDAALALAMIHVIIYEDLYDKPFVREWTTGFQELKDHAEPFTPDWAEQITGVPASLIREAATRYAKERPSVIDWGVAIEHTPNALQTVRAIALLRGITGNIACPGSDVFGNNRLRPYPTLAGALPRSVAKKRLGASDFKLLGGFRAVMPSAHIPAVMNAMLHSDPYPVRALLNFGSNPLVTIANSRKVARAIQSLDLVVVADMFMTPTAAMADYILPAAFWPETDQIVEIPYITGHGVMAQQKVVSVGSCLQDEAILGLLSRALGLPGAEESLEQILDYRLEPMGITFSDLKQKGHVFQPPEYHQYLEAGFRTPSKKIELYSRSLERMGFEPLPGFAEPPESPVSRPDLVKTFPYVLTTGARNRGFFHSEHRQIASLRKRRPHPIAEIHPDDANDNVIKDGDWIVVASPRGEITMQARITDTIARGCVNIDHGWWFPEKEATGFGLWESNANLLTDDGPPYDRAFGTYQLRGLLCSIRGVTDTDENMGS